MSLLTTALVATVCSVDKLNHQKTKITHTSLTLIIRACLGGNYWSIYSVRGQHYLQISEEFWTKHLSWDAPFTYYCLFFWDFFFKAKEMCWKFRFSNHFQLFKLGVCMSFLTPKVAGNVTLTHRALRSSQRREKWIWIPAPPSLASLIAQLVKNPSATQETLVRFLDQKDPLEKG